jgi:hypothetical protein
MSHFGIYEFYRRQALALTEPQTVLVRLLAPQNLSHVFTITGRQILIPADRIIQVSEEEARPAARNRIHAGEFRLNPLCAVSRTRPSNLRLAQENEPKRLLTHREPVHPLCSPASEWEHE